MDPDYRYHCAMSAALVILEFFQANPGGPQHELLAKTVFSILHAFDRYEEEKGELHGKFSVN